MTTDREMTAEEVIEFEAEQCYQLAQKMQKLMAGQDLGILAVVMVRLLATGWYRSGLPRENLEQQFQFVLDNIYGPAGQEVKQ